MHRFWWTFLSRGLIAVALGIAALLWPQKSFTVLVYLIGGFLVIDGLSNLFAAIGSRSFDAELVSALVGLAAGLAVFFWNDLSTNVLMVILGIWALVNGISLVRTGFRLSGEHIDGAWLTGAGAVLALFGLVALFWRSAAVTALSWLIGLFALAVGVLLILAARKFKGLERRLAE